MLKEENTFVQLDKKIKYAVTHLFACNNNECLLVFPNEVRMKFDSKRSFQDLFCSFITQDLIATFLDLIGFR